jgi:hypothetical protein
VRREPGVSNTGESAPGRATGGECNLQKRDSAVQRSERHYADELCITQYCHAA